MSSTLNKIKDAINPKTQEYGEPVGTRHSRTDPRTHAAPGVMGGEPGYSSSANYTTAPPHHGHAHGSHGVAAGGAALPGPAPNTAGPHRSDLLNKLDPSVDSTGAAYMAPAAAAHAPPASHHHGQATTVGGPHKPTIMDKPNPNVDSQTGLPKQSHTGAPMAAPVAAGAHHHTTHQQDSAYAAGAPHKPTLMDKLNPNVDSQTGLPKQSHAGAPMAAPVAAGGHHHATHQHESAYAAGVPHKPTLMDKLDPNVDSQTGLPKQNHTGAPVAAPMGAGVHPHHATHQHDPAYAAGAPHKPTLMDKLNPNVDSQTGLPKQSHAGAPVAAPVAAGGHHSSHHHAAAGTYGSAAPMAAHGHHNHHAHGMPAGGALPGPAPNTAGPHRSDLLNKLDPSVDSKGYTQPRY